MGAGLRILNADAQSITGLLLRLKKAFLDAVDGSLRRLNLFPAFWKPGHSLIDKFVAKQLIGGKRQQNLKLLERQVQPEVFVSRFVPSFLPSD